METKDKEKVIKPERKKVSNTREYKKEDLNKKEVKKEVPKVVPREEKKVVREEIKEERREEKNNNTKKYIIIGVIVLLLLLGIYLLFFKSGLKMKEYSNDSYRVTYENSWSLKTRDDNLIILKHKKGDITFRIVELTGEDLYKDIDDLFESIRFEIESDNKDYKLISYERAEITVNCHDGYNIYYKDLENEVKVSVYKDGNRLVLFSLESDKDNFDLLLYSANNVLYNFTLLDKEYALADELDIKTSKVELGKSNEYKSFDNKDKYEIADNHYLAEVEVPKVYKPGSINSKYRTFKYDSFGDSWETSSISINIYKKNLFRYLVDRGQYDYYSIFNENRLNHDKKDFKESLDYYDKDKNVYIYKASYKEDNTYSGRTNEVEQVILVYPLNKNHIFTIKFDNQNVPITKELVESVKVVRTANYSSYTKNEIIDNKVVAYLDGGSLYGNNKIKLMLPTTYKEFDDKNSLLTTNIYERRYFGKEYLDDYEKYKYEVTYELASREDFPVESENNIIDLYTKYGNYKMLTKKGTLTMEGKDFNVYEGYFTKKSDTFYSKLYNCRVVMLTYKLPNDKFLSVMIQGINVNNISNEIIKEVVSFEVLKNE